MHALGQSRLRRLCGVLAVALLGTLAATGAAGAASGSCSSFGPSWARSYNAKAKKDGNPIRIVSACCKPGAKFGLNSCFVMVTLAGTNDLGCESTEIDAAGMPVGAGKHETCPAAG
jgi:hypothetical protein